MVKLAQAVGGTDPVLVTGRWAARPADMPGQAAEKFGVLGHAVHVRLENSKAFLEYGELLEEPFLGELPFRALALAFISSVDCFFHEVLLAVKKRNAGLDHVGVGLVAGDLRLSCRCLAMLGSRCSPCWVSARRGGHSTSNVGLSATGREML